MESKSFDQVMDMFKAVPGVKEHLNKPSIVLGKIVLRRRLELGLTQKEVVEIVKKNGETLTQSRLSKLECGDDGITMKTYDKVIEALGERDTH